MPLDMGLYGHEAVPLQGHDVLQFADRVNLI